MWYPLYIDIKIRLIFIPDEVEIERAAGFNFAKLKQRFPELQKEIKQFAKYVSDTSAEIQPMKAWQMGDLR